MRCVNARCCWDIRKKEKIRLMLAKNTEYVRAGRDEVEEGRSDEFCGDLRILKVSELIKVKKLTCKSKYKNKLNKR